MTGTASGTGKTLMDFDNYKNQEWLRRRKLRLEQVRKQSSEIAKALRQKVIDGEKTKLVKYERMSEANIRDWKAEKLAELEWKLKSALEEFGESHRQAEEEYEWEESEKEKTKVNFMMAQRRGDIAQQEEVKMKRMAEEKKMSPILRKQMARKKEDLRSALVCSVPLKKQFIHPEESNKEQTSSEKVTKKKVKRKKQTSHKSCLCKIKNSESSSSKGSQRIWINLNDIQNFETSDSGLQLRSSKSSLGNGQSEKEKPEGTVEFYDFSSRYHSKTFREFPHLVERINSESVANANELAEIEIERKKEEVKRKMEIDALTQERGMEALKREKIQRDYNNLITKLRELNKKEKILKAQQRNTFGLFHMNDERLSERARNKQRMMDAKFEKIYFEATSHVPQSEPLRPFIAVSHGGGGDFAHFVDEHSIRPSFSSSHSKLGTPVMSQEESFLSCTSDDNNRRPGKNEKKHQLLLDIDRALKEGRELRKTASRKWESKDSEREEESENKKVSRESDTSKASSPKGETKMKSQESQTDDIKEVEKKEEREDLKCTDKTGNESLPISSATSYKSLPSVIRSYRLRQFLASFDEINEDNNKTQLMSKSSGPKNKVNKLFYDLLEKQNMSQVEKNQDKSLEYPSLEYYIEKLLSMSRECIANLSVSSENISTPNITDMDVKEKKTCTISSRNENLVRKSTLDRANQLEETIKNWKKILGKNSKNSLSDEENVSEASHSRVVEDEAGDKKSMEKSLTVECSPNDKSRYEEIRKKCSERISELSDMLNKVRRDKEKLLSSTSGGSSVNLSKDERMSEKESAGEEEEEEDEEEKITNSQDQQSSFPPLETFIYRLNLAQPLEERVSTAAVAGSRPIMNPEESLDSWPDMMDELLKKEILTSPFKWSEGECSEFTNIAHNQTKPSSIETVIGNFRKKIKKIKPFSLSDSFPQCEMSSLGHSTLRHSFEECFGESFSHENKNFPTPSHWSATENGLCFQEESSVESINHALTSLGLNWAKSFLRKNKESRAMSSSSNSVEKSSEDEEDDFH